MTSFLPGSRRQDPRPRSPDRGRNPLVAWAFIAPALLIYSVFVLIPIGITVYYSLLRWNGIGVQQFRGLQNYVTVLTESDLLLTIGNAFQLVIYFTVLPVGIGLGVAQIIRKHLGGPFGTTARTILLIQKFVPLVAYFMGLSGLLASTGV